MFACNTCRSSQLHQMQYDNENIQESTELIEEGTLPAKITYEKNDFQSSSDRLEKAEDSIHGRKLFRRFSDVILDEEGFLIDDEVVPLYLFRVIIATMYTSRDIVLFDRQNQFCDVCTRPKLH